MALPSRSSWLQEGQHTADYRRDRPRPVPIHYTGQPKPGCSLFRRRPRARQSFALTFSASFGQKPVHFVALLWPCRHALRGCKRPSTPQTTGATGQGPSRYITPASPSPGAAFLGAVRVHGSRSRSRLVPVLARNRCISWHCCGPAVTLFVAARGPAHRRLPARPAKARADTRQRPAQARVQPF